MRVAILTTDARDLFRRYHQRSPDFGTAPQALLEGMAGLPGLEVHVLSCTRQPTAGPAKLAENIFFHSLTVPLLGWLRTAYQGCIRAVRRKLREIQPDIVHGQGTERDCAISAICSGYPNVVTLHGIMRAQARLLRAPVASYYWCAAHLEAFALRRTAGVLCNSAYTESLVSHLARQTWRVPNALRLRFFEPPSTVTTLPKPVLLNVGIVCPRKRQNDLLKVAERLSESGAAFELHFVGALDLQSPYGLEFQRLMQPAEAQGYARYCGVLDTAQLVHEFDKAAALVHFPSEEAFGLVVAEALARNLKLFAGRVGGIPDIARDVEGAELFETDDLAGLQRSIARWLQQDFPKPANSQLPMRQRYHPTVVARRHLEIYSEVLRR